jgi:hypothetical protein
MIHNVSPVESGAAIAQSDILAFDFDAQSFAKNIPRGASTKAHFANQNHETIRSLNPSALAEFQKKYPKRLAAFSDFPLELMTLQFHDAACAAMPQEPPAQAMRLFSRLIYQQVLDTMLGRVIFAALGRDMMSIYRHGPRAFELFEKEGTRVKFTQLGGGHFRYDFAPSYSPIEINQVGIIEGIALFCGVKTEIYVKRRDLYYGSIECKW